jgi:hypothetical protein
MSKKIQGSNLRKLSIAYAGGRLDRNTYLRLRTQQLGALEFNKPLPLLSEELLEINVPSIKLDAPYSAARSGFSPLLLAMAIAALVALSLGGGLYYAWQNDFFSTKSAAAVKAQPLTPESQALKLIAQTEEWTEADISAFIKVWSNYSSEAKDNARTSQWYGVLENEIIQRINKLKLQKEAVNDEDRVYQARLNNLRIFYAQLVAE